MSVFHLGLNEHDLQGARIAVIPGDPARVGRISAAAVHSTELAVQREFTSHLAWVSTAPGQPPLDTPIVVCSTGIGGPSTSIAVEELAQLGVRTFVRCGTTGAIQPDIQVGTLIVTSASVRLDGASRHFAPLEYPAAADFEVTTALVAAARATGAPTRIGITASSDTFYPGQERYDTFSGHVATAWRGSRDEWTQLGVLNYEMESATLFTMCATMGLRAGCLSGVIVNRNDDEIPDETAAARVEQQTIAATLVAAAQLVSVDTST